MGTTKDLPDYTRQMVLKFDGGFVGLEELATRLGFIGPGDLRGNVVLMDSFESEETEWTLTPSGTGSAATRGSRHKYSGDWSLKLVAGNEVDAYAEAVRQIHHPGIGKYAMFGRLGWNTGLRRWSYGLVSELAGTLLNARIRYTLPTTTLEVYAGAGVWTVVSSSLTINSTGYIFHPIIIIADFSTGYYGKAYINDTEYDLSAYEIPSAPASPGPYLEPGIYAFATGVTGCTLYTDDIIVVKNIP